MSNMYEIIIIILLIVLNGLLAMSEIAFVSAKRFRIEEEANNGNMSARKALVLLEEPEKFLSAIQIGITMIGILAGAFGGYSMAEDLTPYIDQIEYLKKYSLEISFAVIVAGITYFSLIIGELVPKSIALNNPEKITILTAPAMFLLSKVFAPFVWFLSISTRLIIFLLGIKKRNEPHVSEEELKSLLEFGKSKGAFEKEETEMIKKIFSFNDKRVMEIMVPRMEIEWIDTEMSHDEILKYISTHHYSKYIVCKGSIDKAFGILDSKEFLIQYHFDPAFDLIDIISDILVVPSSIYSIELFEKFRVYRTNIALIVDEHGGTRGLITLHDLIENIVGDIPEKFDKDEQEIFEKKDNFYLINGSIEISKLSNLLKIEFKAKDYTTLGGFLMKKLGKIPSDGDRLEYENYDFEVLEMDEKRVGKVRIQKLDKG